MQIEGRNAVMEALKSNTTIDKVMVSKGQGAAAEAIITQLKERNIKIQFENREILDKTSVSKNHQGFIAFSTEYKYFEFEDLMENGEDGKKLILILDNINDPHNLGSIIRSSECMGVTGIIIPKNRAVGVTDTVVKVSQGATSYVKVAKVTNINDVIKKLKVNNFWVMACEADGENLNKTNLLGNIALVIGSEGEGVSKLTRELCDVSISIEMKGKVNSLNAGVATGIMLYEVQRQRNAKMKKA